MQFIKPKQDDIDDHVKKTLIKHIRRIKKNENDVDKLYHTILSKNPDFKKYCNNIKNIKPSSTPKKTLNSNLLDTLPIDATINMGIEYVLTQYCNEKVNILKNKQFFKNTANVKIAYLNKAITINYNSLNDKVVSRIYDINVCSSLKNLQDSIINTTWLKEMNLYIASLSVIDSLTIRAYTYHGDGIINGYIRSNNKMTDDVMKSVTTKLNISNGYDVSREKLEECYQYINDPNGHNYKHAILYLGHISNQYFPFYLEFIHILKTIKNDDISKMLINNYNDISTRVYDNFLIIINEKYHIKTHKENICNILHTLKKFSTDFPVDEHHDLNDAYQMLYVLLLHIFKFIDKWVWKLVFESYINRLENIINNSPSVPQTMIVFRGVHQKNFITENTKNSIFRNKGFVSTTVSFQPLLVSTFYHKISKCCILKIKLLKGSKALFVAGVSKWPDEIEFLLPMKTNFVVHDTNNDMLHPYYNVALKTICNDVSINKVKVLHMVAI